MPMATPDTGWLCKPANNTFAGRRLPQISVQPRCSYPLWQACNHGLPWPEGLKKITGKVHASRSCSTTAYVNSASKQVNTSYFDTLKIAVPAKAAIEREAINHEINFRYFDTEHIGISVDDHLHRRYTQNPPRPGSATSKMYLRGRSFGQQRFNGLPV